MENKINIMFFVQRKLTLGVVEVTVFETTCFAFKGAFEWPHVEEGE